MYKSKYWIAVAVLGAFLVGQHHAHAAKFDAFLKNAKTNFWIVTIDGSIQYNDDLKFKQLIAQKKIDNAVVFLSSPGGNVLASLDIGFQIRNYGFKTWVPDNLYCASMCASIWLAGAPRYSSSTSHIGFHSVAYYKLNKDGSIQRDKNGVAIEDPAGDPEGVKEFNNKVAKYYNYLGVDNPETTNYLVGTKPEDMAWLTFDKAKELGIELETFDGKDTKTSMQASKK